MSDWLDGEWLAFDTESTGVDTETDRIVSAALVLVKGAMPLSSRTWLIDPGIPIPEAATAVHKITTEHARAHGQDPRDVLTEISDTLLISPAPIVGFNCPYDLGILAAETARYCAAAPNIASIRPVLDALVLDKHVDRYRKGSRKLSAVCEHYGVPLGQDAHGAEADALAAARVVWKIAKTYPEISGMTLLQLHDAQVEWALEQQDSLAAYFAKTKPEAVVERGWPLKKGTVA